MNEFPWLFNKLFIVSCFYCIKNGFKKTCYSVQFTNESFRQFCELFSSKNYSIMHQILLGLARRFYPRANYLVKYFKAKHKNKFTIEISTTFQGLVNTILKFHDISMSMWNHINLIKNVQTLYSNTPPYFTHTSSLCREQLLKKRIQK